VENIERLQQKGQFNNCGALERMIGVVKNDLTSDRGQEPSNFERCSLFNGAIRQAEAIGFAQAKKLCKGNNCKMVLDALKIMSTNPAAKTSDQISKVFCTKTLGLSEDKFYDSVFFLNAGGYRGELYPKAKAATWNKAIYLKLKKDCAFQFNTLQALTGVPLHKWKAGNFVENIDDMGKYLKKNAEDPRLTAEIGLSFAEGAASASSEGLKYIQAEQRANNAANKTSNILSNIGLGGASEATFKAIGTGWKESSKAVVKAFNAVAGVFRKKKDSRTVWKDGTNPAQFFGCPTNWRPYMRYNDRGDYGKFWYGCQRDGGYGGSPAVFYNHKGEFGNDGLGSPDHYGIKDMCSWSKQYAKDWKPNPCKFRQK
jgi:hypothetical protein